MGRLQVVGEEETVLRKNLWDEENRLIAVDLKPDENTSHPVAVYTYDAGGARTVRYNYDRIDVHSNSTNIGEKGTDNVMLYPSGLLTGKAMKPNSKRQVLTYTKHYYIGAERISAKTGTSIMLGHYPHALLQYDFYGLDPTDVRPPSDTSVTDAEAVITTVFNTFGVTPPAMNSGDDGGDSPSGHDPNLLDIFYFHPDHLGSSSYISNKEGNVSQHMEYLPFGETLVDEHTNSYNSPFKFNEGRNVKKMPGGHF